MLEARARIEEGVRLERAGSVQRAIEKYEVVAASERDPEIVAEALRRQAVAYRIRCDWELALEAARRSADVAKSADLSDLFAEALNAEAIIHQSRGDFAAAVSMFEQILSTTSNDRIRGMVLQNLGSIAAVSNQLAAAEQRFRESGHCFRAAGYLRGEVIALTNRAALANLREDFELARSTGEAAMAGARRIEDFELRAHASLNVAEALAGLQQFAQAEEIASTAFGYFAIESNTLGQVACLLRIGDICRTQGKSSNGARCYEYGLELARKIDAKVEAAELTARLAGLNAPPPVDPYAN